MRSPFYQKYLYEINLFSAQGRENRSGKLVPSGFIGYNTLSETNLPPYDINLLESKEFWEEVVEDLKKLKAILSSHGEVKVSEEG